MPLCVCVCVCMCVLSEPRQSLGNNSKCTVEYVLRTTREHIQSHNYFNIVLRLYPGPDPGPWTCLSSV